MKRRPRKAHYYSFFFFFFAYAAFLLKRCRCGGERGAAIFVCSFRRVRHQPLLLSFALLSVLRRCAARKFFGRRMCRGDNGWREEGGIRLPPSPTTTTRRRQCCPLPSTVSLPGGVSGGVVGGRNSASVVAGWTSRDVEEQSGGEGGGRGRGGLISIPVLALPPLLLLSAAQNGDGDFVGCHLSPPPPRFFFFFFIFRSLFCVSFSTLLYAFCCIFILIAHL